MTARYNALVVVLENDVRDDDAEPLMNAIRVLRGVADVSGNVASIESYTSDVRARYDLGKKLLDVVYGDRKGS